MLVQSHFCPWPHVQLLIRKVFHVTFLASHPPALSPACSWRSCGPNLKLKYSCVVLRASAPTMKPRQQKGRIATHKGSAGQYDTAQRPPRCTAPCSSRSSLKSRFQC
eukprot:3610261-Pleurochrysis_carterae.AAC.4